MAETTVLLLTQMSPLNKPLKSSPFVTVRDQTGQWLVCVPGSGNCQSPRRCKLDAENNCSAIDPPAS